ncbi:hypothetical protein Scep_030361 [Stephania cephalantha]|uniref:Terpene synthase N-terminal domain-containing protein n=1 Tax=Stephania cephalantha TaxID=152367 RepID=A0AAP0DZF1_9MAGN
MASSALLGLPTAAATAKNNNNSNNYYGIAPPSGFRSIGDGVGVCEGCSSVIRFRCNAISNSKSKSQAQMYNGVIPKDILWRNVIEENDQKEKEALEDASMKMTSEIKSMFRSMGDGEITVSAYDTAWVALVRSIHGSGDAPQFPSSLEWIINHQLPDGSWGDQFIFSAHDRMINTLACVIALKSWNVHPQKRDKGMKYIRENIEKIGDEKIEHMPVGFEVALPSLIEIARDLDLEFPEDSPVLQDIYAQRNLKLTRIPREMMHTMPTTLLHSLEGMAGLDWERILKFQCSDGSLLFSPSSTAFALMQTKDEKCLEYLIKAVERFGGGVPNVYPVDMFEHIWAVDRLERLGVSRYFESEIKECMNYVARYWTEDGICWARNSNVHDIDDTAMGFRLLRLHGHEVSPDAFRSFQRGEEFFCFAGQSNQAITGIYNLFRASQVSFPGEKILEEARAFAYKFLREKQAANKLLDKWIIAKDLPGEVGYALDVPWYASLPRIETRFYIEQYGGEDDVWIGKTLYRMNFVSNNTFLELAKLDFNKCQTMHQLEWVGIQKWYLLCNLGEFGLSQKSLLQVYFLATASIFEGHRSTERLAWTRTAALVEAISLYFNNVATTVEQRRAFVNDFIRNNQKRVKNSLRWWRSERTSSGLLSALSETIDHLSLETLVSHSADIRHHLRHSWERWLLTWIDGEENKEMGGGGEAELVVRTVSLSAGNLAVCTSPPQYRHLLRLTNALCHRLRRIQHHHQFSPEEGKLEANGGIINGDQVGFILEAEVESYMQELVKCVLQRFDGIDQEIKKTFLTVAKTFFYTACCSQETINLHIAKVLFERVP